MWPCSHHASNIIFSPEFYTSGKANAFSSPTKEIIARDSKYLMSSRTLRNWKCLTFRRKDLGSMHHTSIICFYSIYLNTVNSLMAVSMLYLFLYSKHLSLVLEPGKHLNLRGVQKQEKLNFNNRNQKVVALQWRRNIELIKRGTTALLKFVA